MQQSLGSNSSRLLECYNVNERKPRYCILEALDEGDISIVLDGTTDGAGMSIVLKATTGEDAMAATSIVLEGTTDGGGMSIVLKATTGGAAMAATSIVLDGTTDGPDMAALSIVLYDTTDGAGVATISIPWSRLRCSCSDVFWLYALSQSVHENGFSPVWISSCR